MNKSMKTPRWVQLIRAHQKGEGAHPNGYGLGIPFLIGGSRASQRSVQTPSDRVRAEILGLLTSFMEDAPADHFVRVDRCGAVMKDESVATLVYSANPSDKGLISQSQKRPTLIIGAALESEGVTSIASLSEMLFGELHQHICHGRFSFRGGKYRGFSEDDLRLIMSSKGYEESA